MRSFRVLHILASLHVVLGTTYINQNKPHIFISLYFLFIAKYIQCEFDSRFSPVEIHIWGI